MALVNSGYSVKWKGTKLGNHAFITYDYSGNCDTRIIPRGKGVSLWSTAELGGGYLTITVKGLVATNSRITLEEYFNDLDSTFELNAKGDLVITDKDANTYTLTNCYLQSLSQDSIDLKVCSFTAKFIKSL